MWNTELQAQPGLGGEELATGTTRPKVHNIKAAIQQKNQDPGSDNDAIPDEAPPTPTLYTGPDCKQTQ